MIAAKCGLNAAISSSRATKPAANPTAAEKSTV